jgi:hypothetical protein
MNRNQEKEKLIRNLFQAIDNLDSTESKETISQAAIRIYNLKREIVKVDPTWRVRDPYNYYVHRILSLLDGIDTRENPNVHNNQELYLKLFHETRMIRKTNQSWRLNVHRLVEFMTETSKGMYPDKIEPMETEEVSKPNSSD